MLAAMLAATLAFASPQSSTDMTRNVLVDVCLPFVTGEDSGQDALDFLGFIGSAAATAEDRDLRTEDQAFLLRMTSDDGEASGDVRRTCVLQARRGGLEDARTAVKRPLEEAGFALEADATADRPVWTRRGVTVSIRQNEGRATVVRISYSSLDAEGA